MPHKLLLADDSVTIQKVIELTFADEDIEVVAVSNGRQAIEMAPTERPDIVLADVGMPERDGYEVAAFIKGRADLKHIPVLLLTGAFEPIDEGRAKAAGCDGVLVKPFEPQMVITRVKDLIAGKRPATGASSGAPGAYTSPPAPVVPADAYFDRLDSVFSRETPPAPATVPTSALAQAPARAPADRPAAVTPAPIFAAASSSVEAAPEKPAPEPPAPVAKVASPETPAAPTTVDQPRAPVSRPSVSAPTLAEAFAALLAAEQGRVPLPPLINDEALREEVVEQVTRRVIERMTYRAVRDIALDVAERLVREEIERIKTQSR